MTTQSDSSSVEMASRNAEKHNKIWEKWKKNTITEKFLILGQKFFENLNHPSKVLQH